MSCDSGETALTPSFFCLDFPEMRDCNLELSHHFSRVDYCQDILVTAEVEPEQSLIPSVD